MVMGRRILFALALVCAGCGPAVASDRPADATLVSIQPSDVTTKIVGASSKQEAVLREILAGLGPTRIETIGLVKPDREWGAPPDAVGFDAKLATTDMLASWHASLAGEAFDERSLELGLPRVAYIADGDSASVLGTDAARALAGPSVTLAEAQDVARRVRKLAERHGAEVRRFDVLKPRRLAFAVELQAKDAATFLLMGLEPTLGPLDQGHQRGTDGIYVKVVDGKGKPVLEMGAGYWVRGDLTACSPYLTSLSTLAPPPPSCPAKDAKEPRNVYVATIPSSDVTTKIVGASPKQRAVLRSILAGLGVSQIEAVEVRPAGKEWPSADPQAVVVEPKLRDNSDRAQWEAELLAEAFAQRSRELTLPRVVAIVTPGGGGGALNNGSQTDTKPETRKPVTAEALAAAVAPAARKSGAELLSAQLLKPDQFALAVALQVSDPARFLRDRASLFLSAIPSPWDSDYGGLLVLVSDKHDQFVWSYSLTESKFIGTESSHPRLDLLGCDPIAHSGPRGRTIPSCPAAG